MNAQSRKGSYQPLQSVAQPKRSPASRRGTVASLTSNISNLEIGPNDKVFPVAKIAVTVGALSSGGIGIEKALEGVGLSEEDLHSPSCRVSQVQLVQAFRNAARLSKELDFAFRLGLQFRVSMYGIYGFALLSSANFREAIRFALKYMELASPLVRLAFDEQRDSGVWTITPLPVWGIDPALYRFLTEQQFGAHVALHRDVMGRAFRPTELHVTYGCSAGEKLLLENGFGCPLLCDQEENRLIFNSNWLNGAPDLANELTFATLESLCDDFLSHLHSEMGTRGRVRRALLANLGRPSGFEAVARKLGTTSRTLRRRLIEERTSFRELADELRMQLAIQYLRETNLTNEQIASCLGFHEVASFQRAFRRWTKLNPSEFRSRNKSAF